MNDDLTISRQSSNRPEARHMNLSSYSFVFCWFLCRFVCLVGFIVVSVSREEESSVAQILPSGETYYWRKVVDAIGSERVGHQKT